MEAAHPLLDGLIDYAGLFPPASLSIEEAAREYAAGLRGPHARLVGRFVVAATRLHELAPFGPLFDAGHPLSLALLASPGPHVPDPAEAVLLAAAAGRAFAASMDGRARIDWIETRVANPAPGSVPTDVDRWAAIADAASPDPVYVELPFAAHPAESLGALDAVAATRRTGRPGLGAKIRCGGARPADVPDPETVACFLHACRVLDIPFKATAGLHHPVRSPDPNDLARAHGFLNVFVAAVLSEVLEPDPATLEAILRETDPAAFSLAGGGVAWRDLSADATAVSRARAHFARSFGSCSLAEPTDDLRALGWLSD